MRWGYFYIHKECISTCMQIVKLYYVPQKGVYKIKVEWWTFWGGKPRRPLYITTRLVKTEEQARDWIEL